MNIWQDMERYSKKQLFTLGAIWVVFISALDYFTGIEISLRIFYLPAIFIFAWNF